MTLYLVNLNVSSFSGAEAGGSVSMGNANVGDWSQSYSKLVLSLGKETSVPWHLFCTALENGSGITSNVFKIISLCCKICKGILNTLLGSD